LQQRPYREKSLTMTASQPTQGKTNA